MTRSRTVFFSLCVFLLGAGWGCPMNPPDPKQKPRNVTIHAEFNQDDFSTYYTTKATDASGNLLVANWWLNSYAPDPAKADPGCSFFAPLSWGGAVWHHGEKGQVFHIEQPRHPGDMKPATVPTPGYRDDGCLHSKEGATGHPGTVMLNVESAGWRCTVEYEGTHTGDSTLPADCRAM